MSLFRREESRSVDLGTLGGTGGNGVLLGSSAKSALGLVPVYSATSLIADSISIMPMSVYESKGASKQRAQSQPQLVTAPHPNPIFTRVEWLHQFATSFLLRGNAYGLITALDSAGNPSKIAWMDPDRVRVDESGQLPVYSYNEKPLDLATVIHVPWYPTPGSVVGLSPIAQFREVLETGSAAGRYGRNWFRNGSTPSGHLKYDKGSLTGAEAAKTKARFKASVAENDLFVSGNDWSWTAMSVKPDEAQFLQTIKATANQVAAIYHVDPQDIGGESGNSLTYTTLEMNQIKFQARTLQPIFTRLEQHITRLLPENQYLKFNPDALIRTDSKTRMEVHEIALRIGLETQDEGRELEDKAPLDTEQLEQWMRIQGKTAETSDEQRAKQMAEVVQKVYLGVGKVLTSSEARVLLKSVGFDIDPNAVIPQSAPGRNPGENNAS